MEKKYEDYGTTDGFKRCLKCDYFDKKNIDCTYNGICVYLDEKEIDKSIKEVTE